jgi:hypothetical protein
VLTPSAIAHILESPEVRDLGTVPIDGFVGPAHVSTIIGSRPYEFFAEEYQKPVVIAGFEPLDVMQAILMLVRQVNDGRCEVENEFTRAVTREGNLKAQALVAEVFELRRAFEWRGLGEVPYSALRLKDAYRRFDASDPFASRCVEEDFNRLWTADVLEGVRQSAELARARELRPLYDAAHFLLDLHSMTDPCPPLALCGRQRKGLELALALGYPEHVVIDAGHAAGKRLRDYAFFDDPDDARSALLVECGQHWERSAPDVARQVLLRFLRHFGMADPDFLDEHLDSAPLSAQRAIEVTDAVTIATDAFAFALPVAGLDVVPKAGTLLARDAEREIRTRYDDTVLVMPTRRPRRGETAVRLGRFVR